MVDVDALEKDWRTNKFSNVELGRRHNCSEGYVRKLERTRGWKRDVVVQPPPPPKELMRRPTPDTADMTNEALTKDLTRRMLDELDTVTAHVGELEDLIESETANDRDGRRRAAMMKAISLPVRANTLKMLLAAQVEADEEGKKGKKEKLQEAAVKAGGGKYKASAPPTALKVVER